MTTPNAVTVNMQRDAAGLLVTSDRIAAVAAPRAAPERPDVYRVAELHERLQERDRLLAAGQLLRIVAAAAPELVVTEGEEVMLRLERVDRDPDGARWPSWAIYQYLLEHLGQEHQTEPTGEWTAEGTEWAGAALATAPRDDLSVHRGEGLSAKHMVAAKCAHGFLMLSDSVSALAGVPAPKRSLYPAGVDADRLAAKRQAEAEAAAKVEQHVHAVRVEAARDKTLRELGAAGVAVRKGRREWMPTHFAGGGPPSFGGQFLEVAPQHETEREVFYLWLEVFGLSLPASDEDGIRVLRPDETMPADLKGPITEASLATMGLVIEWRKRAGALDLGPIDPHRLRRGDNLVRARALMEATLHYQYAPVTFVTARLGFLAKHFDECVTRGLLVDPTDATAIWLEVDAAHRERFERPVRVPTRWHAQETALANAEGNDWMRSLANLERATEVARFDSPDTQPSREAVGARFVRAARAGHVGAGELLEEPKPTKKSKAR